MQLDRTRIAVRERGVVDTLDLSLRVAREFAGPLFISSALGFLPLMLVNQALIGWMAQIDYREETIARYVWNMILLVILEAPLASALATMYLGQAVFLQRPSMWQIVKDVVSMSPRLLWCHGVVRMVLPAWGLLLLLERGGEFNPLVEAFLLPLLVLFAMGLRAVRPFINEIILLERNRLSARNKEVMTAGRRSSLLHSPASGDLIIAWMASASSAVVMVVSMYLVFLFASGVFLNDWSAGPVMMQLCLPAAMWIVASFMTVVRFLNYLDLRIRQEGWEVELQLRAEALHFTSKLT